VDGKQDSGRHLDRCAHDPRFAGRCGVLFTGFVETDGRPQFRQRRFHAVQLEQRAARCRSASHHLGWRPRSFLLKIAAPQITGGRGNLAERDETFFDR